MADLFESRRQKKREIQVNEEFDLYTTRNTVGRYLYEVQLLEFAKNRMLSF